MIRAFAALFLVASVSLADGYIATSNGKADAPLAVGDWRSFHYKGKVDKDTKLEWEIDPMAELGRDDKGNPILVYGMAGAKDFDKPLTTFKIVNGELETADIPVGDTVVWGKEPGKVKITVRGRVDGRDRRLEQIVLTIIPRGPPTVMPVPGLPPGDQPTGKFFFVIAIPNSPPQSLVDSLALPEWAQLEAAGHQYKPKTVAEIKNDLGYDVPSGTRLPAVITLTVRNKQSHVVGLPRAFPTTGPAILSLADIKP